MIKFPKDFLWGAGTAAHQIEGNTDNQWDRFERNNAKRLAAEAESKIGHLPVWNDIKKEATKSSNYICGSSADSWNKFSEDHALAEELGFRAHRFSIAWDRIEPVEGEFNRQAIRHYQAMINSMVAHGLEPFMTLWHWTVPKWFEDAGGWTNPKSPEIFNNFVSYVCQNLENIRFFITLNEPNVYIYLSLITGEWPPNSKSPLRAFKARRNLVKAHRLAYQSIKQMQANAVVGMTENLAWLDPLNNSPITKLTHSFLDRLSHYFLRKASGHSDFVGLNNYFHVSIKGLKQVGGDKYVDDDEPKSDLGWSLAPNSLYHAVKDASRYKMPIYITEHGLADREDKQRAWFLRESLKGLARAIDEGCDVRGYLHWALLDNFEWAYGFWPRFGLIQIDYLTKKRWVRPSAYEYAKIIKANGLNQ